MEKGFALSPMGNLVIEYNQQLENEISIFMRTTSIISKKSLGISDIMDRGVNLEKQNLGRFGLETGFLLRTDRTANCGREGIIPRQIGSRILCELPNIWSALSLNVNRKLDLRLFTIPPKGNRRKYRFQTGRVGEREQISLFLRESVSGLKGKVKTCPLTYHPTREISGIWTLRGRVLAPQYIGIYPTYVRVC
jgi:hypothetical protein